jgi:hypothetical protein
MRSLPVQLDGSKRVCASLSQIHLQRYSALQSSGEDHRKGVHQALDGQAFLRHTDEDFTRLPVWIQANRDVAFMPGDLSLVALASPLLRSTRRMRRSLSTPMAECQGYNPVPAERVPCRTCRSSDWVSWIGHPPFAFTFHKLGSPAISLVNTICCPSRRPRCALQVNARAIACTRRVRSCVAS